MSKRFDAIIIGGGISGIVTVDALTKAGFKVLLVEKSTKIGGFGGSFKDAGGNIFDYGFHVIDYKRNMLVTRLFERVLGNLCSRLPLRRGLVIKNQVIEANLPPDQWPEAFQGMFSSNLKEDPLGASPSRDEISKVYGNEFTDLAFAEIVESYPVAKWSIEKGWKKRDDCFSLAYPWFFPMIKRTKARDSEHDLYHDKVREQPVHEILYPKEGGFGKFCDLILKNVPDGLLETKMPFTNIDFDVNIDCRKINSVVVDGEEFVSDRIFWNAPLPFLFDIFKLPSIKGKPQTSVLGSFAFEKPVLSDYQEILVGDPNHLISRINCPNLLRGKSNILLQVENFFPAGMYSHTPEQWEKEWLKSLKGLGLLKDNKVVHFDFKEAIKGVATEEPVNQVLKRYKELLEHPDTNIIYPFFGIGTENLNRILPSIYRETYRNISK